MIPIVLVTGFLGSGKTTFINWLLEKQKDLKISIILNEFGDIKLESQFITKKTANIVELANGCMCCVAKSDIPRVVSYILEHSPNTEYILIEASGLSDPDPVREALQTPPVNKSTFLESTVCVIDAVNFEKMRSEHPIINAQIADADLVVISKASEAGTENTERVKALVENLTPDVKTIIFEPNLSADIFLPRTSMPVNKATVSSHEHIHEEYQIYLFESEQALSQESLIQYMRLLQSEIIRVKGIVKTKNQMGQEFFVRIQKVGNHVTSELVENASDQQTTILFIGKNFNQQKIEKDLVNGLQ